MSKWWIFRGNGTPHDEIATRLPDAPRWRNYMRDADGRALPADLQGQQVLPEETRGKTYFSDNNLERDLVNAALLLRRPLLVTGNPGTGKTSLAYALAYELKLGPVLVWPVTTRATLQDGLYRYDAIARLQAATLKEPVEQIGRFLRLGPLGTALRTSRPKRPRVLLIDEIDKSDIDLPNDLLHIFEEGKFEIPELARLPERDEFHTIAVRPADDGPEVAIERGLVRCYEFPIVVMTSNGERDFPPAFLRRCLRLTIDPPNPAKLATIVKNQLDLEATAQPADLVQEFLDRRAELATDQLLNAIFLTQHGVNLGEDDQLRKLLLKSLSST